MKTTNREMMNSVFAARTVPTRSAKNLPLAYCGAVEALRVDADKAARWRRFWLEFLASLPSEAHTPEPK